MTPMDLLWNPPQAAAWTDFHRRHDGSLQQAWAYGEALRSLGIEVTRVVAHEQGTWRACAQFIARRVLGYLSLASCSRGPVFADDVDAAWRADFYRRVRRHLPLRPLRVPLFSPNTRVPDWNPAEAQGMQRVLTGYSTVMLDLERPADHLRSDMDPKWRNRLVRAETTQGLKIFSQPSRAQMQFVLAREGEQRKRRGFFALPTDFTLAYVAAHDKPATAFRIVWAEMDRQTVASMLFLLHGSTATYHIGWANQSGRDSNAHNALLWRAMMDLPGCGVRWLDLGGVNTRDLAGISRFKLGAGGQIQTLPGTFF
jgi:lipid II:glycine glycyltransferase (peptidoglycan interpeptide bridge formation enzyme)